MSVVRVQPVYPCDGTNLSRLRAIEAGKAAVGNVRRISTERTPMTTVSSTPQTVEYSGVNGLTLVADEWNRGADAAADRPMILLLHGGGQTRHSWKNTGQVLADEGFHVVALDSRGHGDSDRAPDADYHVETLTADVMHVLDAIGRPVMLIGASMGGLTGILAADQAGPRPGHAVGAGRRGATVREGRQRPHPGLHVQR